MNHRVPNPLLTRRPPWIDRPRSDPRPGRGGHPRFRVLTVSSNKGGVGKTTLACNLAVYIRALHEDLPVLLLTLDDQPMPDRMFAFDNERHSETIVTGVRQGSLTDAIRLGQYGVHYVPSSAQVGELKSEIASLATLWRVLEHSDWHGLVIIDTKSDFEVLTQNAIAASDLALVLISDHASLGEARRVFELMDEWGRPRQRARVVLSLVDRRVKFREGDGRDILALLVDDIRRHGYPMFESFVSRSPSIEGLYTNPEERAYAILHRATKSLIHRQMHHLAEEVLSALEEIAPWTVAVEPDSAIRPVAPAASTAATPGLPDTTQPPAEDWGDRRGQLRRSYTKEVAAFRRIAPPIVSLRAHDISPEGIGIEPASELASSERVHIALPRPRGEPPLFLWARVVRSDETGARGLAFESATPVDRNRLEKLGDAPCLASIER
jgi:cellulose biosynthesis protein BcsQ